MESSLDAMCLISLFLFCITLFSNLTYFYLSKNHKNLFLLWINPTLIRIEAGLVHRFQIFRIKLDFKYPISDQDPILEA